MIPRWTSQIHKIERKDQLIELARELAQARERCAGLERLLDERAGDYRAHEAARLGNPLLPVMETALAGL